MLLLFEDLKKLIAGYAGTMDERYKVNVSERVLECDRVAEDR